MPTENNEEVDKLKANCLALENQVKLLVKTELKLRRTQADLIQSKEKIEEYSRTLEQRVVERTEEINKIHQQIITQAHQAGMAEIATGILHNKAIS